MFKKLALFLIGVLLCNSANAVSGLYSYADNSLLATGRWVKIRLVESGVYKFTYQDLTKMGFANPAQVRVYGFGGAMLPEEFKYPKADAQGRGDLPEVPIFDGGGYILFWAQGVVSWTSDGNSFKHTINPYSNYAYYFLTDSQGAPTPMTKVASTSSPEISVSTFNDYALHEVDKMNIGATGREFYGEDFSSTSSQIFPFAIAGVSATTPMQLEVNFISKSTGGAYLKAVINDDTNNTVFNSLMPTASRDDSYERARELNAVGTYLNRTSSQLFNVKLTYSKTNEVNCRLNYIRLNVERNLMMYNAFTPFRSIASRGKNTQYTLTNADANVQIWNISNGGCIAIQPSISGNVLQFSATSPNAKPNEYVAVNIKGNFATPEVVGEVPNQNLHALPQTDLVIVSHPSFVTSAEKLAKFRRENDNLKVTVVLPEQIYNEFSSGTPDASAIRWFMKMFYDRAQTVADRPKYLLLFGDGTYDNRLLGTEWRNSEPANKILTYESPASLIETSSYVCDDYFGFLDDYEGQNIIADGLDLGIGRFPVRYSNEAENVVNKVINYSKNLQLGAWKNNLCFVADDGDNNLHMGQSNELTQYIEGNYKQFVVNKIFFDSYKKDISATGASYPAAKKKLFDLLNTGVLTLNYTGHGSVNSWAVEQIMTISDIRNLYLNRLPLWITATCDFSRFDDYTTTAGEEVLLHPQGGGIGLITTTRVVYSAQNFRLNNALMNYLFAKNNDGTRLRLGDIMRQTKLALGGYDLNKMNFTLIGDPSLKLAYPEHKMEITQINGHDISAAMDTISALSEVTLSGKVLDPEGNFEPTYNGVIKPTIYDYEEDVKTLNNDGTGAFNYKDRTKILFTGKDSIRNGLFTFKFTVPKDMSYSYKSGRVNLYGSDNNRNEAQGYFEKFLLGGTNLNAPTDNIGPSITKVYLNSPDFVNGNIVNEKPLFVAEINDESGLNVSGTGIGHDILLGIDGSPNSSYILNNYYEANSGSSKSGKVMFNIPEMSEGKHTLSFRIWDIQNNSSTYTMDCEVKKGYAPRIFDLYANNLVRLTNPNVTFHLKHDRPNTNINVKISVYNLSGVEVWSHVEKGLSDIISTFPTVWDLRANNGQTITPDIYLYRASIYTEVGQETTQTKKLIVISR